MTHSGIAFIIGYLVGRDLGRIAYYAFCSRRLR